MSIGKKIWRALCVIGIIGNVIGIFAGSSEGNMYRMVLHFVLALACLSEVLQID